MAGASFMDPLPFQDFPQFDPSDLSFAELPLPEEGISSDLDLDDLDLDFSVDDLFLHSSSDENNTNNNNGARPDSNLTSNSSPGSPESANSAASGVITTRQEVKKEKENSWRLKRKVDDDDDDDDKVEIFNNSSDSNPSNCRSVKIRRSEEGNVVSSGFSAGSEEDEKRKARLIRNRESAQLSRQRKKHYVEELEEKVKIMNSTIADLNGKISFYMAENARLHQQLNGGNTNNGNGNGSSPVVYPPPPPYHFPWLPYAGYAMRPNGTPVPYVPIPRLKPQQPASAPKGAKKSESKKGESKTKKVASVSLLGLFLVMMVFGSAMNFGLGGSGDGVYGGSNGRILSVKGRGSSLNSSGVFGQFSGKMVGDDNHGGSKMYHKGMEGSGVKQNSSESLPALLYVPRNGKHVEINGNLIIHSVLASERAMAQAKAKGQGKKSLGKEGTGLAIPGYLASALAVPKGSMEMGRHPKACRNSAEQPRALPSDSHDSYRDNMKSTLADGPLQQWFREGLAGPILSSGTCTEVFQFEVSPSVVNPGGGIIPTTSVVNGTDKLPPGKIQNRRILYGQPIPLNGSALNNTEHVGKPTESSNNLHGNNSAPSMVVSILADPREAGDGDADGMITPKSLSRVFVVVLMDSVKYATYSCVLPLKSHGPHLVN